MLPALLVLAPLAAACSDDEDTGTASSSTLGSAGPSTSADVAVESVTYVGDVEGTELAVAAVVDGDDILLYLCDGHNGVRSDGTLEDQAFTTEVDGLGEVSIAVEGDTLDGTLVSEGASYEITGGAATGDAGLLWAADETDAGKISAGWIVAADGSETGGVVAGITDGTSNIALNPAGSFTQQDGIIAILIGVRAPVTAVR